mmetsp:Transcript_76798/g.152288  ORF Transcript_76798/g.152288 Transcript_76798/m.152288 type:complete len:219 (+) Transcript_76798:171-827(+)
MPRAAGDDEYPYRHSAHTMLYAPSRLRRLIEGFKSITRVRDAHTHMASARRLAAYTLPRVTSVCEARHGMSSHFSLANPMVHAHHVVYHPPMRISMSRFILTHSACHPPLSTCPPTGSCRPQALPSPRQTQHQRLAACAAHGSHSSQMSVDPGTAASPIVVGPRLSSRADRRSSPGAAQRTSCGLAEGPHASCRALRTHAPYLASSWRHRRRGVPWCP